MSFQKMITILTIKIFNKIMGIFDLYCKICHGPFYYPDDIEQDWDESQDKSLEELYPGNLEFSKLFDWIKSNAIVYPDGRIVRVGEYITNEGVTTNDNITVYPAYFLEDDQYWNGLAVHVKCLSLSNLTNGFQIDSKNYNRLFYDTTYGLGGECGDNLTGPDAAICEYTEQEFRWENIIGSEHQYLIEDPEINLENQDRIVQRGEYVQSLPLTPVRLPDGSVFDDFEPGSVTIQTSEGPVLVTYEVKYFVEGILNESNEVIQQFADILKVSPTKFAVLQVLKENDLLIGPDQDLLDHPDFPNYSELSVEDLERLGNKYKYAVTLPKITTIRNILTPEY